MRPSERRVLSVESRRVAATSHSVCDAKGRGESGERGWVRGRAGWGVGGGVDVRLSINGPGGKKQRSTRGTRHMVEEFTQRLLQRTEMTLPSLFCTCWLIVYIRILAEYCTALPFPTSASAWCSTGQGRRAYGWCGSHDYHSTGTRALCRHAVQLALKPHSPLTEEPSPNLHFRVC